MNSLLTICVVASALISTEPHGSTYAQCQKETQIQVKVVNFLKYNREYKALLKRQRINNLKRRSKIKGTG